MREIFTPAPWTPKGFSVKKSNGFKITQQRPVGAGDWEIVDKLYEADARLIAEAPVMYGLLKEFVDRVERGEVRSKKTYAKFKEVLSRIEGAQASVATESDSKEEDDKQNKN